MISVWRARTELNQRLFLAANDDLVAVARMTVLLIAVQQLHWKVPWQRKPRSALMMVEVVRDPRRDSRLRSRVVWLSLLLCGSFYHVLGDLKVVDYSLVFVDSGGLVWWEPDYAVHQEIEEMLAFLETLENGKGWSYQRYFVRRSVVGFVHFNHEVPPSERPHQKYLLASVRPYYVD